MKKLITTQLRERASVKGKQKTWVSACTDDQLYQLYVKLRNGESAKSIAQYVQKAWGVNPESKVHSISQGILKFKRIIQDLLEVQIPDPAGQDIQEKHLPGLEPQDNLLRLERLVQMQSERIERMIEEERNLGIKHSSLSRDLQPLASISKELLKEKTFALRHRGEDPVKQRKEEVRGKRIDANFNTCMAHTSGGGRGSDCCELWTPLWSWQRRMLSQ